MDLSMNPRVHFLESEEARFRDPSSLHSSLWFESEKDPGTVLLGARYFGNISWKYSKYFSTFYIKDEIIFKIKLWGLILLL